MQRIVHRDVVSAEKAPVTFIRVELGTALGKTARGSTEPAVCITAAELRESSVADRSHGFLRLTAGHDVAVSEDDGEEVADVTRGHRLACTAESVGGRR